MSKQKLHEMLGLSVEETLNRLIRLGQIMHKHKEEFGEPLNLKHFEAVLHANSWPKEEKNT
jgi:hypothetical protein